jgi:deoxyribodipyrimidine photo-lyase
VFERSEILTQNGQPYGVFTPYKNNWLKKVTAADLAEKHVKPSAGQLAPVPEALRRPMPSLEEIGFEAVDLAALHIQPGSSGAQLLLKDFVKRINHYQQTRDFPSVKGPSYLSVHLRFGTVSTRRLARLAYPLAIEGDAGAQTWLGELIWRDFYHQILHHHPRVVKQSFKPVYDAIDWETGKEAKQLFAAWCEGRTGYPLVDAAMAQINQTGYMHNRLRMVVACFLVKDLGIDWRWGEQYFAQQLIDFDLAANNGGWQWASSSGCDAQPYFRIFNPISQSEKFDSQGKFIRRYLPQLAALPKDAIHAPWLAKPLVLEAANVTLGKTYPLPIVDHAKARLKTLMRYSVVKSKSD